MLFRSDPATRTFVGDARLGALDVALNITTSPVTVAGMEKFLRQWFIPQITLTDSSNPAYQSGLFFGYWQAIIGQYTKKTRANIIADLAVIGSPDVASNTRSGAESARTRMSNGCGLPRPAATRARASVKPDCSSLSTT